MNHCMLMAEIIDEPQLRYTQENQTPIAEFTVSFPGLRDGDAPQQMKVVGWGNLAQEIQARYHAGDRVLLEGRLAMNTVDRPEGFREKRAEMTAQRVYRLSDLTTMPMPRATVAETPAVPNYGAAAPTTAPAAAPTSTLAPPADAEVDYDDIPF